MIGGAKGIGIGIDFGIPNQYCRATSKPYIEKDVLDSLRVVVSAYGKSNNDADRSIVKNLVDPDNPFVISNAAYEGMSGYNGYPVVFGANKTWRNKALEGINGYIYTIDANKYNIRQILANNAWAYSYIKQDGKLTDYNKDIKPFKIKVTGLQYDKFVIKYSYINSVDATDRTIISITSDGIYELPKSFASDGSLTDNSVWIGFNFTRQRPDIPYVIKDVNVTIEILPSFEGAFVTDGVNDLITSTKPVQEMLGGSNEITVVSMIHQVKDSANNVSFTNYIRGSANGYFRNIVNNYDKTGIYGYTSSDLMGLSVVNNILGDKNDYTANGDNRDSIINGNFSVQGYSYNDGNNTGDFSSVAWYWTIIANKVLTTDQINQVIAYFNLDRTLNPDILCNTIKQGITNENHAEFGDKLIDFSGNGRDIQLNNIAWKGDSGIGKYEVDFSTWSNKPTETFHSKSILEAGNVLRTKSAASSMKVKVQFDKEAIGLSFRYFEGGVSKFIYINSNGEYSLPPLEEVGVNEWEGFSNNSSSNVTITQIPSHAGALCLDGVNDFGKVTGMPIYKDYTVVADYIRTSTKEDAQDSPILSKSQVVNNGAFAFNYLNINSALNSYSFGTNNGLESISDSERKIYYQSKYVNDGKSINSGTGIDYNSMWLGTYRDNVQIFFNGAIYSLMSFPYSMSEFLIERQLKKHKLGTLYPDMVEFRPIVKSNVKWNIIGIWQGDKSLYRPAVNDNKTGIYLKKNSTIGIYVKPKDADEVTKIVVNGTEYTNLKINSNGFYYVTLPITKSPQKINITIDEYIRYEDIVQPYPVVFQIKDRTTNQIYSWGDKIKVGSSIQLFHDESPNLLSGLYRIDSYEYEGKTYTYNQLNNLDITLTKSSISISCNKTYLLDDNEPKCILSPERLRIPNSSYSILGYIPDISGHGNNFTFNNFLFSGMSGANGYQLDFKTFTTGNTTLVNIKNDSMIEVTNVNNKNGVTWINLNKLTSINLSSWTIKVTGMKSGDVLGYYYSGSEDATTRSKFDIREDGTYSLPKSIANSNNIGGIAFDVVVVANSTYRIEQIGEYEGSICFDGIDDFILNNGVRGGKQIIMKCNWWSTVGTSILYDQRGNGNEFAIFNADSDGSLDDTFIAYSGRSNGNTYIDGILNSNIHCRDLIGITHNITHTNELNAGPNSATVRLGCNNAVQYFTKMALYDFILFDEISTDDKIQELNKYVGIEAKVELPPYYWDTYGKTNSDADRDTIQQRGVAVGDYDLINYNHAYEGMSGYNGYPVVFGESKTWKAQGTKDGDKYYIYTSNANKFNITQIKISSSLFYTYIKRNGELTSGNKDIPSFNLKVTGLDYDKFYLAYYYLKSADVEVRNIINITSDGIYELPKSFASDGSLTETNSYIGLSFIRKSSEIPDIIQNVNVTIEVLPEYENGLAYDGVEDYSENVNVPALTDYTYIFKRTLLNKKYNSASIFKGSYQQSGGGAFICDYNSVEPDLLTQGYSFGAGLYVDSLNADSIVYGTRGSVNGQVITSGNNTDTEGLTIGKWRGYKQMVFYKLILYPKTIPLLQINFLKNLMERDEIIDLNNPIFIQ